MDCIDPLQLKIVLLDSLNMKMMQNLMMSLLRNYCRFRHLNTCLLNRQCMKRTLQRKYSLKYKDYKLRLKLLLQLLKTSLLGREYMRQHLCLTKCLLDTCCMLLVLNLNSIPENNLNIVMPQHLNKSLESSSYTMPLRQWKMYLLDI